MINSMFNDLFQATANVNNIDITFKGIVNGGYVYDRDGDEVIITRNELIENSRPERAFSLVAAKLKLG